MDMAGVGLADERTRESDFDVQEYAIPIEVVEFRL